MSSNSTVSKDLIGGREGASERDSYVLFIGVFKLAQLPTHLVVVVFFTFLLSLRFKFFWQEFEV